MAVMSNPQKARLLLDQIKLLCTPTIDRGDAHGKRNQSGRILWDSQEDFVIAAITAALDRQDDALAREPRKKDGATASLRRVSVGK